MQADVSILEQQQIVIACGAAGVELLSKEQIEALPNLCVAIDLNALKAGSSCSTKLVRQTSFDLHHADLQ